MLPKEVQKVHPNMTEGYYHDDCIISSDEAEQNRFQHFVDLLGIKEGDSVLDCGCGHGGLVMFLRTRGIDAEGITICRTQFDNNTQKHGNYFYYGDYTEFHAVFQEKYDFIILPGSLEHPFGGNVRHEESYIRKHKNMTRMFSIMSSYFKKDSVHKKVLVTALHMNNNFKDTWEAWCIERTFGGLYPPIGEYSVEHAFKSAGYNVLMNKDYTWHYYFASVCDVNHFGNPVDWGIPFTITTSLFYPFTLYAYLYNKKGLWAWQFDGKHHKRRTDDQSHDLTFEKDMMSRPTTLFYTIAEFNK